MDPSCLGGRLAGYQMYDPNSNEGKIFITGPMKQKQTSLCRSGGMAQRWKQMEIMVHPVFRA